VGASASAECGVDYRRIFEAAPSPYLLLSADLAILDANAAYLKATLTRREEICGRSLFDVFPDNPEDESASGVRNLAASLARVKATRMPDTMAIQKYDIPRPVDQGGGFEERYWSPVNTPVLDSDNNIVCIIHRVEDVTDFVRSQQDVAAVREDARAGTRTMETELFLRNREVFALSEQLRQANTALADIDRAKTAFFSNVSHEFRTPLTLILGPLEEELAETAGALPAARRERLEVVHRNALRLLRLVNTLLDFARVEAGRYQASFHPTNLSELTAGLAANFANACERAGLRLVVDCPSLPEPVFVDPDLWEKIVLNLVSNAFKFTRAGRIAVQLRAQDTTVELKVSDTGCGIPADELPRVFDRFHRVRGVQGRSHEGSGIGLALTRELVALHGGSIQVSSTPGVGSTFVVTLPRGKAHLPIDRICAPSALASTAAGASPFLEEALRWLPDSAAVEPSALIAASSSRVRPRILWADDNKDMRDYVSRVLSDRYDVEPVADGEAALESTRRQLPDLVVTDIMMPRLDGMALLKALRADPRTRSIPVILLSARAGDGARAEASAAGADDYVVKPFSAKDLLTRVSLCLELAQIRRAAARPAGMKPLRIVVAEGKRGARDDVQALFLAAGYEVMQAHDGEHALQLVRSARPDLLVTDFLLPKVSGLELIHRVRGDPEIGGTRILVWSSAYGATHTHAFVEPLGLAGVLTRPSTAQELLDATRAAMQTPAPRALASTMQLLDTYQQLVKDKLYRNMVELEKALDTREQAEIALRESEQATSIIASAMEAIITIDADQRIVLFNEGAEAVFGVSMADAVGTSIGRFLPEELREAHSEHVRRFLAEGASARKMGEFRDLQGLRANGEVVPIEASISRAVVGGHVRGTVIVRDASERVTIQEQIRRAAMHDPLTQLPNRTLLYEHIEKMLAHARRGKAQVAFLFVDLDHFKTINDTYGHEAGDKVLKEVAQRLSQTVREEDTVGRLGGDEFVVAISGVHRDHDAARVAQHLLDRIAQPLPVHGREVSVSPSIGISLYPQDGSAVDQLIRHADSAMYRAKRAGRNGFEFFQNNRAASVKASLRLESRMRRAIELGEFELHFQPIVELHTRRVAGAEALARWPSMQTGPDVFIPVAEAAGVMPVLGSWILQEACRQRRAWHKAGLPAFPVAVNVSPTQFRQRGFADTVVRALADAGLTAQELELEISESLAMQNVQEVARVLEPLRELGVAVALDDFGTGFSSLAYLTQLPLDVLKLDKSFVGRLGADTSCEAVTKSMVALAGALRLQVVAEGIESEDALAFLRAQGCRRGQGYLFAKPMPAEQFIEWCRKPAPD